MKWWTSSAFQWGAALLMVGAIVAYCLIDPRVSVDAYWIRVGIASVAMTFLCLSFFYFVRSTPRRVYIVTGTVVPGQSGGCSIDMAQAEKEFWINSSTDNEGSICSICLGEAREHRAKCCQSYFHKECAATYWKSANEIICPNCRFTLQQTPLAEVI